MSGPALTASPDSTVAPDPKAAKRANYDPTSPTWRPGRSRRPTSPSSSILEVSSRCNLRCKKCGFAWDPSLAKSGKDLPWPILSRMDDFFAAAVEVYTFGYGEMFLYPELAPLVTVLKNHGCRLSGVTNGVLIRPADVVWLVATGYDHLAFSIDGATEETMQKLRGASLAKVLHVLQLIHEEKAAAQVELPSIVVNFVAQNDNYPGAPGARAPAVAARDLLPGRQPASPLLRHPGPYAPYYEEFRLGKVPRPEFEAIVDEARVDRRGRGHGLPELREPGFRVAGGGAHAEAATVALHNHPPPEAAIEAETPPAPAATAAAPAPPPRRKRPPLPPLLPVVEERPCRRCTATTPGRRCISRPRERPACAATCRFTRTSESLPAKPASAPPGTARCCSRCASTSATGASIPRAAQCVPHRSYEIHAAAMNPDPGGARDPGSPAAEIVPEPVAAGAAARRRAALRKLLKRWRKPPPAEATARAPGLSAHSRIRIQRLPPPGKTPGDGRARTAGAASMSVFCRK